MLVLGRKVGEVVYIGENEDIVVTILEIRGNQVRLGFTAPAEVPIRRKPKSEERAVPPEVHHG